MDPISILVVVATAISVGVGFYLKGLKNGETFNPYKCGETVLLVLILAATGILSNIEVTAEWLNAMIGSNPVTLTAIIAAFITLIEQLLKNGGRIISSGSGSTQAVVTEQAKASLSGTETASPSFASGKGTILGIYAGTASGGTPAPALTLDVNNLSTLFFDIQALVTGKVVYSVKIDGVAVKDVTDEGVDLKEIGKKYPCSFYVPNSKRTPGAHIITITTGHLEGQQDISPGGSDSKIVYEGSQDFGLTFTGTKASD